MVIIQLSVQILGCHLESIWVYIHVTNNGCQLQTLTCLSNKGYINLQINQKRRSDQVLISISTIHRVFTSIAFYLSTLAYSINLDLKFHNNK